MMKVSALNACQSREKVCYLLTEKLMRLGEIGSEAACGDGNAGFA
jgi:hypothetical protein